MVTSVSNEEERKLHESLKAIVYGFLSMLIFSPFTGAVNLNFSPALLEWVTVISCKLVLVLHNILPDKFALFSKLPLMPFTIILESYFEELCAKQGSVTLLLDMLMLHP